MAWVRYVFYFAGVAVITSALTQLEIQFPGSLKLHVIVNEGDKFGTSEYSPIEIIQPLILGICGLLMAWVAKHCPSQRPIAFPFGGLALAFLIRELDYFFDLYLIDNLWQVLAAIAGAFVITYTYRQRRRLKIAWGRIWPSPGIALLFAGAIILFAYVRLVGHEPDMDSWGYSFRLGATRRWFENDADDAVEWLLNHGLVDRAGLPTFKLRGGV